MKTTNVKTLRDDMINVYDELRLGKIGNSEAKQLANVAGKIISSVKTEIEYNKLIGSQRKIKFLEPDETNNQS